MKTRLGLLSFCQVLTIRNAICVFKRTSLQQLFLSCAVLNLIKMGRGTLRLIQSHCNTQHIVNYCYPTDSIFHIRMLLLWRVQYIYTVKCRYNPVHYSKILHNNCRNSGRITISIRISIRGWAHKRHPISRTDERNMGCVLWQNWPRYNGSTLYLRGTSQRTKNYLIKHDVYIPSLRSSC